MADEETEILDAFTRIRVAAEEYMNDRDSLGHGWDEETVTGVSTHKGAPQVQVIYFTKQHQEPVVGADYLWWFLDRDSSVCFGMMVQAKRLKRTGDRWTVDIRHGDSDDGAVAPQGRQYADLLRTAEQLDVPAMYAIYAGGLVFRDGFPCFHEIDPAGCKACRRMAISMISAYQLSAVVSPADTTNLIFNESVPLEDLVDPAVGAGLVRDLNLPSIPDGPLREFLLEDQVGPIEVAKRIFRAVSKHRKMAFSQATADPVTVSNRPLFPEVPDDLGHFPGPYFEHVLRGLQVAPPQYLLELLRPPKPNTGQGTWAYQTGAPFPRPQEPRIPQALRGLGLAGVVVTTM